MVPRVLPAHEGRTVLLRAVHQLQMSVAAYKHYSSYTYEEPHGCAEAGCHESVEGLDWGDLDGVVWVRRVFGRAHADS
jgi:hypothetical protein